MKTIGTTKITPSQSSSIEHIIELRLPFPIVQNSDHFFITFNLKFKTQELTKFKKSKHQLEKNTLANLLECISINQGRLKDD